MMWRVSWSVNGPVSVTEYSTDFEYRNRAFAWFQDLDVLSKPGLVLNLRMEKV